MNATLNELWIRIFETFISGSCFAVWAGVALYIALRKGTLRRKYMGLLAACFAGMSFSSYTVCWAIYHLKPVDIAWGAIPSILAKMFLAMTVAGNAPRISLAWSSWWRLESLAQEKVPSGQVETVHVRLRPIQSITKRWALMRSHKHGSHS